MKTIEITSKTDSKGNLKIDYQLDMSDSKVKVLILIEDNKEDEEEKIRMDSISNNPAFGFLKEKSEDIYSLNDGEPFYH